MPSEPHHFADAGGMFAYVCMRRQRRADCQEPGCHREHVVLCDYALTGKAAGRTCDRKCCRKHAVDVGENRHHCPAHARLTGAQR